MLTLARRALSSVVLEKVRETSVDMTASNGGAHEEKGRGEKWLLYVCLVSTFLEAGHVPKTNSAIMLIMAIMTITSAGNYNCRNKSIIMAPAVPVHG